MHINLSPILLCADRSSEAQDALRKASILARYLDAKIELFACDTEHGWAVSQSSQSEAARAALESCLAASRIYVEALRGSIAATDLQIATRVACARGRQKFRYGARPRVARAHLGRPAPRAGLRGTAVVDPGPALVDAAAGLGGA
jgi:hypothetical protein